MACISIVQSLNICNQTVSKLQICSLDPEYNKGSTDYLFNNQKMKMDTRFAVNSIAEFDQNHKHITLDLILSTTWNDSRLTIESPDSEKYETFF